MCLRNCMFAWPQHALCDSRLPGNHQLVPSSDPCPFSWSQNTYKRLSRDVQIMPHLKNLMKVSIDAIPCSCWSQPNNQVCTLLINTEVKEKISPTFFGGSASWHREVSLPWTVHHMCCFSLLQQLTQVPWNTCFAN